MAIYKLILQLHIFKDIVSLKKKKKFSFFFFVYSLLTANGLCNSQSNIKNCRDTTVALKKLWKLEQYKKRKIFERNLKIFYKDFLFSVLPLLYKLLLWFLIVKSSRHTRYSQGCERTRHFSSLYIRINIKSKYFNKFCRIMQHENEFNIFIRLLSFRWK